MPSQAPDPLRGLATTFQVDALGQGDPTLGFNLLAAMAGVLADLAPNDDTILTKEGKPARLGVNLLVTGSASASLVTDEILTEVGLCQTNFTRQMRRYAEWIDEQERKRGPTPPMGQFPSTSDEAIASTQSDLGPIDGDRVDAWARALVSTPPEDIHDLIAAPRFLVSATRPGHLEGQLEGLRRGKPLISVSCSGPHHFANLAEVGATLISGNYPLGTGGELVQGHFLLTDPMRALEAAAKAPDDRTAWLGHFLWLCDGEAGPEAPKVSATPNEEEVITQRFRHALGRTLARRMNLPDREKQPIQLVVDTRQAKIRFNRFLRDMETSVPGIWGAAHNLLDSLVFGLGEIANSRKGAPFTIEQVEALARFLVKRMANARTMILHSAAVAQRRSHIERVFRKLEQGPATRRMLYRPLSIPAPECDACLRWLQLVGLACLLENRWRLVEGARLQFDNYNTPLLEV